MGHLLLQRSLQFQKEDVLDDECCHDDFGYFYDFSVALDVMNTAVYSLIEVFKIKVISNVVGIGFLSELAIYMFSFSET